MTERRAGWARVAFGDVVKLSKQRSSDPEADGFERYVGLEHLDPGDLRIRRWGDLAEGTTFTSVFRPGQVLFGKRRAYQRKVAVADFPGVCSGDIYVLEPKNPSVLLPDLLPFICQTEAFFEHAVGTSAGSLSPRTHWSSLSTFEFELPSSDEQRRLVESLATGWNAVEALRRLRLAAVGLRRSLGEELFRRVLSGGRLVRLRDVVEDSSFGPRFSSSLYSQDSDVKVIRTTDFREGGRIDYEAPPRVDLPAQTVARHALADGDFLLSRSGEYAGMTRVFEGASTRHSRFIPAAYLIRFRLARAVISPLYLHEYCESPIGERAVRGLTQGSAQPNISGESFLDLRVPLSPLGEQVRICDRLGLARKAVHDAADREAQARRFTDSLVRVALAGGHP